MSRWLSWFIYNKKYFQNCPKHCCNRSKSLAPVLIHSVAVFLDDKHFLLSAFKALLPKNSHRSFHFFLLPTRLKLGEKKSYFLFLAGVSDIEALPSLSYPSFEDKKRSKGNREERERKRSFRQILVSAFMTISPHRSILLALKQRSRSRLNKLRGRRKSSWLPMSGRVPARPSTSHAPRRICDFNVLFFLSGFARVSKRTDSRSSPKFGIRHQNEILFRRSEGLGGSGFFAAEDRTKASGRA